MALTGLTGLQPVVIADPGAPPEIVYGGPANPAHGQATWEVPPPAAWASIQGIGAPGASYEDDLIGTEPDVLGASSDPSLYYQAAVTGSHAAPWPAFGTEDGAVSDRDVAVRRQLASQNIHASDTDDGAFWTGDEPASQMPYEVEADYVTPGETILQPVPDQLRGQYGRDRVQGWALLNDYGLDSAHVHRRRADGRVPGNYCWLGGRGRPMVIQPKGRQSYPVGQGSFFEGQTPGTGSVDGTTLVGLPPQYQAPPVPPVASASAATAAPAWSSW